MICAFREDRTRPGPREDWVRFMEEAIIPFLVSKGMAVTGSVGGAEEPGPSVWLRRFEREEERAVLCAAVYESAEWKDSIAPRIRAPMDREGMEPVRLVPTPKSVLR